MYRNRIIRIGICVFLGFILVAFLQTQYGYGALQDEGTGTVYVIPVKGEITPAMAAYLEDQIGIANAEGAEGILIEISTLGGLVQSARDMRDSIINSEIPVAVFIKYRAVSAGSLISIAAEKIIMAPGSHIGSAEPVPYSDKAVAYVKGEFEATAEKRGRNKLIAMAMVDKSIEIPDLSPSGSLLDMTAETAKDHGYADAILPSRREALEYLGWGQAKVVEVEPDFRMKVAQFLTRSDVSSILVTVGALAILIEIFTQGFGLAGAIGISSYALYFGGNLIAGNTEWWAIALFIIGIGLLIAEAFVPGFGFLGIGGIVAMIASLVFAAPDPIHGLTYIGISFIAVLVAIPVLFRLLGRVKVFDRLILSEAMTTEKGYVNIPTNTNLVGKTGVTVTPLRPSGTARIEGVKMDVVSDGDYLPSGTKIRVIGAEGARVVVTRDDG